MSVCDVIIKVSSFIFNSSYPVWISDVQCDSTYQHILRCDYTDAPNTTKHTDDWYLTCCKCYQLACACVFLRAIAINFFYN